MCLVLDQTSVTSPPSSWWWVVGGGGKNQIPARLPRCNLPRSRCLPAPITAAPSPCLPFLPARPPPWASRQPPCSPEAVLSARPPPCFSGGRPLCQAHLGLCLTLAFLSCPPGPLPASSGGRPLRPAPSLLLRRLSSPRGPPGAVPHSGLCLQPVILL